MNSILLVMKRKVLADALVRTMKDASGFALHTEYSYQNAPLTTEIIRPAVTVLEIPESGEWTVQRCLVLCDRLREAHPGGKILILCPEENPDACHATIAAVQEARVNDFVFYDTSWKYLVSKMEAMAQHSSS